MGLITKLYQGFPCYPGVNAAFFWLGAVLIQGLRLLGNLFPSVEFDQVQRLIE